MKNFSGFSTQCYVSYKQYERGTLKSPELNYRRIDPLLAGITSVRVLVSPSLRIDCKLYWLSVWCHPLLSSVSVSLHWALM